MNKRVLCILSCMLFLCVSKADDLISLGNSSLSPNKKWYVDIWSTFTKVESKQLFKTELRIYDIKGSKIEVFERANGETCVNLKKKDIPVFEVTFLTLLTENARNIKIAWKDDSKVLEISFKSGRIFKYNIQDGTFSFNLATTTKSPNQQSKPHP